VRSYIDRWVRQLVRRGIRSGLIEGSNLWLSIGALAWLFRFLTRKSPPQISVENLRLGESVLVSHVPAPPRSRRARKKAAKQQAAEEKRRARYEASRRFKKAAARAAKQAAAAEQRLERKAAHSASKHPRSRSAKGPVPSGEGDGGAPE
jgi:hypothetical protein